MYFEFFAYGFLFLGSAISMLLAIEQFTGHKITLTSLFRFLHLFASAVYLLGIGLVFFRIQLKFPITVTLFFTSIFLAGPSNYWYHRSLIEGAQIKGRWQKSFVLPALLFIMEVFLFFNVGNWRNSAVSSFFETPLAGPVFWILVFGTLHTVLFFLLLLRFQISSYRTSSGNRGLVLIIFGNLVAILSIPILFIAFAANLPLLYTIGCLIVVFPQYIVMLTQNRYPEYFSVLNNRIRSRNYKHSRLKNVDTESLEEKLFHMFKVEKLYCHEDLDIHGAAHRLSIRSDQLSEYLNTSRNLTFRNYINSCRIEEAKRLLLSHSGDTILDVCFAVGFKSKSSFNQAFRKFTGTTPSEFKKNGKKGSKS